jgi:hypothetical protein
MPNTRLVSALLMASAVSAAGCKQAPTPGTTTEAAGVSSDERVPAGGVLPVANALSVARPAAPSADAGGSCSAR